MIRALGNRPGIADVAENLFAASVISFRGILQELIAGVKTNRNYQKSDLLQVLRLLKNYELLKEPQMELKLRSRRKAKN